MYTIFMNVGIIRFLLLKCRIRKGRVSATLDYYTEMHRDISTTCNHYFAFIIRGYAPRTKSILNHNFSRMRNKNTEGTRKCQPQSLSNTGNSFKVIFLMLVF